MGLVRLRTAAEPLIRRAMHTYWRFQRGMTLGVRGLVISPAGEIFLIKHSYVAGWHMPGGGVETGETVHTALVRELEEEGNITGIVQPALHGVYFNAGASRRDHIALFVVREFRQLSAPIPDREIVAHGFFAPDALPEGTTGGTRRRIAEVLGGAPVSETW